MVVASANCRALALVACKTAALALACEAASLACRVYADSDLSPQAQLPSLISLQIAKQSVLWHA